MNQGKNGGNLHAAVNVILAANILHLEKAKVISRNELSSHKQLNMLGTRIMGTAGKPQRDEIKIWETYHTGTISNYDGVPL